MERRGANNWLVAVLAGAVGFLAAALIFGTGDSNNSSATVSTPAAVGTATTETPAATGTTTSTQTATTTTAPPSPEATTASCIALWNQTNNRGPQTFLVNLASREPVRVNVGQTTGVPAGCFVTIVANDGTAYTFPPGGDTGYPYAPAAAQVPSSTLPAAQKTSNALEQRDGTLQAR
jgi:hypothetical protein